MPDGHPCEYYKAFSATLVPHMARLFNSFIRDEEILRDIQSSFLTLIPKTDKDHILSGNYRPIALLNSVLKILMKWLSLRLNEILPSLIQKDQVGLVHWRQAGNNTSIIDNIIDIANQQKMHAPLLSLDAEKAFGRLSWPFFFTTLEYPAVSGLLLQSN